MSILNADPQAGSKSIVRNLKKGHRGVDVKHLQLLLDAALRPRVRLPADGVFGDATHSAVLLLQQLKQLHPDGIVGPQTRSALGISSVRGSAHQRPPTGSPNWMKVAIDELGVSEIQGARHNQRIVDYHQTTTLRAQTDEVPWCSSFVNWVMIQAGFPGTNNALAKSWLNWGSKLEQGRYGAITVIKRIGKTSDAATGSGTGYHVGFYASGTTSSVQLLGGNQGDQVKYSNFPMSKYSIEGFRWP
ncbi:MAG: TIGR02594 family protein [Planctomyces sp.]|nr:TIGR02594 family protein [Planctomyces sp.]